MALHEILGYRVITYIQLLCELVVYTIENMMTRAILESEHHDNNIILREGYKQGMRKLILQITEVIP